MDPSQHSAPAGWPSLDDTHGTAWMRKNLIEATFGTRSQHATLAGGSIQTPPSPDSEFPHRPQHYNLPMPHLVDGERPPTPPLHHHEDAPQYQHHWDASLPIRDSSGRIPLPAFQDYYTSPYGTYTPAHHHLSKQLHFQSAPSCQHTMQPPRLHPSANLLRSSPQQQTTSPEPTLIAPSIQQWPTHNLKVDAKKKKKKSQEAHERESDVDGKTRKKQDAYRRKGEAVRRRSQTLSYQNSVPQYTPIPEPASMPRRKRKAMMPNDSFMPTLPPPLRHVYPAYGQQQQSVPHGAVMNYSLAPQQPPFYSTDWIGQQQQYHTPISSYNYPRYGGEVEQQLALDPPQHSSQDPPHTPALLPPSPPKVIDPETIPQHITNDYEDYKWPVKLYQLQVEKGYDFAECFLETYFQGNIYDSEQHKWHTHITKGFIKDADRLSILVLHNAADPFEWGMPPESTTSIGVYGLYAHKHAEIHWTTIAPSIQEWLKLCSDHGFFTIKQEWHCNMKASDKRFHRAYWLAAKMLPLNRILNNSLVPDKPYGIPEDSEGDEFAITEEDLQHEWVGETMSVGDSEKIWQKLVEEVDGLALDSFNPEHFATGGSERAYMVD